jgi:hypothetical protein
LSCVTVSRRDRNEKKGRQETSKDRQKPVNYYGVPTLLFLQLKAHREREERERERRERERGRERDRQRHIQREKDENKTTKRPFPLVFAFLSVIV